MNSPLFAIPAPPNAEIELVVDEEEAEEGDDDEDDEEFEVVVVELLKIEKPPEDPNDEDAKEDVSLPVLVVPRVPLD